MYAQHTIRPWIAVSAFLLGSCSQDASIDGRETLLIGGGEPDGGPGTDGADDPPTSGPCADVPIVIHNPNDDIGGEYTPGALPELYLIGIVTPDYTIPDGELLQATVHVVNGGPMVLALSAHVRTHWTVDVGPGASVEHVILVGYHEQTATAPAGVLIESHGYDAGEIGLDTFCGFDWPSPVGACNGRPTSDCCTEVLIPMVEAYAGRKLTAFAGTYQASEFTVDGCDCTAPACEAPPPLRVECSEPGGAGTTNPSVAAWLASATTTGGCGAVTVSDDAPALFPSGCGDGRSTTVTFTATDGGGQTGTCSSTVTVVDSFGPTVTLSQTAACLWPPSHEMAGVASVAVSDVCDPNAAATSVAASSDERTSTERGVGGPEKCPDAEVAGGEIRLRAERAGPSGADNGRVYGAVTVTASDSCGNSAEAALPAGTAPGCPGAVCVPHDHGAAGECPAVDDGQLDATVCN
jgi:hypothetical protein